MEIKIKSEQDYVECTRIALKLTKEKNYNRVKQSMFATIVAELARNILDHVGTGTIEINEINSDNNTGFEVIAHDNGGGIENIDLAMTDSYSTKKTLGLGLPGAKRLSDEFYIESIVGKGTTIKAKKWRD